MEARKTAASTSDDRDAALALEIQRRQREAWLEENREAIKAYNEHVAQHGVFSKDVRGF